MNFTTEELNQIHSQTLPRHVAIIPDGNRRWAQNQLQAPEYGHRCGADTLMDIVEGAKDLGIKVLTVYFFSTENWARSPLEVEMLMGLLENTLKNQCDRMARDGVKLETIGNLEPLPKSVFETVQNTKEATEHCQDIQLVLAINYGSRDELIRSVQTLAKKVADGEITPDEIDQTLFANQLDTAPFGDPELLIRTSGERRISNFLLWQLSYSELYLTDVLWPDFTPKHLWEAINDYQKRSRRLGS
jgi:undecaprenyl diphosphate synthase